MEIDYNALVGAGDQGDLIDPREIFSSLPEKDTKFSYLRDVQGEVLGAWFNKRSNSSLVIKMNTGAGKTTVGLLILQSCLNEGKGPAIYLTPDNYLATQVKSEAAALGITLADSENDPKFLNGECIFVTNVTKLFNGRSVFGVRDEGIKIALGSILIDDAHACLSLVEEQFTVRVEATDPIYKSIFELFRKDLEAQSESKYLDLADEAPGTLMMIPYSAWIDKISEVHKILKPLSGHNLLQFTYRLVKADLHLCRALLGSRSLEISPPVIPLDAVPAFKAAQRRIYVTATLADDSILVSHFGADPALIQQPIVPISASDIGDRMILIPQEINTGIKDDDIRKEISTMAESYNVVVIVPSEQHSKLWGAYRPLIALANNLQDVTTWLRTQHIGLVVFVNKYDGVDLPGSACRVLVIDGVPDARKLIDQYEEVILSPTPFIKHRKAQKIEQGIGRGVRSSDDFCVVVIIGAGTLNNLYPAKERIVTPATRAQLELWDKLKIQLKGKSLQGILGVASACLKRASNWVSAMKLKLAKVKSDPNSTISPVAVFLRQAFDAAQIQQYRKSATAIQEAVNLTTEPRVKGYFQQKLAEITYHFNKSDAHTIQLSAITKNASLLKPLEGIEYTRLSGAALDQSGRILEYLKAEYDNLTEAIVGIHALADKLIYQPDKHQEYEEAFYDLGLHLGFIAQRPERDFGRGPDELWSMGQGKFLLCECKSEVETAQIWGPRCFKWVRGLGGRR